jgi:hypothetical protein
MVFEPGEAAQVDFGRGPSVPYGGAELLTWAFVMTLCWSRHQYVELVRDQSVETWLGCHQRAFEFFGGVPARVIVDNAKCAITRACFHDPTVQRSYAELAEGYDFRIDPCPPRAPEKKGRVESGIKFFKQSFVPLREFRDLEDANRQAREWVLGEAGQRIHGSTRERPLTRFLELERGLLRPLPLRRVEPCSWARVKVARDCHVRFEHAYYSVPYRLIGHTLWLAAGSTLVRIYDDSELVASHVRSRPGEWRTVEDHLPPEAVAYLRRSPQWCRERAQEIGPHCAELVHRLQGDQVLERHRAVQGIVRLAERYGAKRLEAACERALRFSSLQYRSVKTILEQGLDAELEDKTAVVLGEAYQGQGRFHRDTRTLLAH